MAWLDLWLQQWGLWGLTFSAFVSATVLPGNSELFLLWYVKQLPTQWGIAVVCASIGNSLGGLTNVVLGRCLPSRQTLQPRAQAWLQRYGAAALLLSWLPLVGDALCVAAGWLRLPWWSVVFFLCVGKTLRYLLLALPFVLL